MPYAGTVVETHSTKFYIGISPFIYLILLFSLSSFNAYYYVFNCFSAMLFIIYRLKTIVIKAKDDYLFRKNISTLPT